MSLRHIYRKSTNRLLKVCYVPATSASLPRVSFFFPFHFLLLRPWTVLMKQTRWLKQSIFLDVYSLRYSFFRLIHRLLQLTIDVCDLPVSSPCSQAETSILPCSSEMSGSVGSRNAKLSFRSSSSRSSRLPASRTERPLVNDGGWNCWKKFNGCVKWHLHLWYCSKPCHCRCREL